ncbi:MAG: peptidylprolyl isomerase [Bacteroidota bacterium]
MRFFFFGLIFLAFISCSSEKSQQEADVKKDVVRITTPQGEIFFVLHDQTPNHKSSFIKLVKDGYFEDYTFNRVIDNFVAQGGCPDTPEGFANSPYLLDPEFHPDLRHVYGAVGAGRDNNPEMRSAGCQFYIVQNKEGLHRLDDKYTVFGQVIKGMNNVDAIVKVETDSIDEPFEPITLKMEVLKLDSAGYEVLLK